MGNYKLCTGFLVTITLYLIVAQYKQVSAAPGTATSVDNGHRIRNRPFLHISPRLMNQYGRFKPELNEFFVDDDDLFELNKRQASDDYGHLRFGKRDEFDDYGHMRFGRSDTESTRQ